MAQECGSYDGQQVGLVVVGVAMDGVGGFTELARAYAVSTFVVGSSIEALRKRGAVPQAKFRKFLIVPLKNPRVSGLVWGVMAPIFCPYENAKKPGFPIFKNPNLISLPPRQSSSISRLPRLPAAGLRRAPGARARAPPRRGGPPALR